MLSNENPKIIATIVQPVNNAYPGFESVHNSAYWSRQDYIGLGLGASSCINNTRYKNDSNLDKYIEKRKNIDNLENYNNSEKAYLIIKKIEVLRQLGRFAEANSLIKMLRADKNISYSYNEVILEQIEVLIASKDLMPAVKPFGNKLHMAIHSNLEINNDIVDLINDRSKCQINKWGFSPIGQAIVEVRIEYVKLLSEPKYKIFEGFDEYRVNDLRCLIKRINNPEISEIIETALTSQMCSK